MEIIMLSVIFLSAPLLSSPVPAAISQNYSDITNSSYIHNQTSNLDNGTEDISFEEEIYALELGFNMDNATIYYYNGTIMIVKELESNDTQNSLNGTVADLLIEEIRWKRDVKQETVRPKRNFRHNPVLQG